MRIQYGYRWSRGLHCSLLCSGRERVVRRGIGFRLNFHHLQGTLRIKNPVKYCKASTNTSRCLFQCCLFASTTSGVSFPVELQLVAFCRDFIVATWLREQTMGMLMWEAKPPWIALRARSFQLHNQLLGFLVIAKDVQQGMIHGRRDFRTRISSSIDSLPPGTSAGKRNRLLMRHLLPDDVQLHSSLLLKSGFLLGKQCQYSFLFCFWCQKYSMHVLRISD